MNILPVSSKTGSRLLTPWSIQLPARSGVGSLLPPGRGREIKSREEGCDACTFRSDLVRYPNLASTLLRRAPFRLLFGCGPTLTMW